MVRQLVVVLAATILWAIPCRALEPFQAVFEAAKELQNGQVFELKVVVENDSVAVLRGKDDVIDGPTAEKLVGDLEKALPQSVKLVSEQGIEVTYEMSPYLVVTRTAKGMNIDTWRKRVFSPLVSCVKADWPQFLWEAIERGLTDILIFGQEGECFSVLRFQRHGPQRLEFGKEVLVLSKQFYDDMRIAAKYPPRTTEGQSQYVVIVHEPHWFLPAQYQLLRGLRTLLADNPNNQYRFLVEGNFDESTKFVPTAPTLEKFIRGTPQEPQVYGLLRNFLSDGPFAYRLLYGSDIPAVAIDDPAVIRETPRQPALSVNIELAELLQDIVRKLQKVSAEEREGLTELAGYLSLYTQADFEDQTCESMVKRCRRIAELHTDLAQGMRLVSGELFNRECQSLDTEARKYSDMANILRLAGRRDSVMAKGIADHFRSEHVGRIPIVFIGSFHTPAITSYVSSKTDLGYVVIEPRLTEYMSTAPESDVQMFKNALDSSTRQAYLTKVAGYLKLQVAPRKRELPFYGAFLKHETTAVEERKNAFVASSPLDAEHTAALWEAFQQNGEIGGAVITFGEEGEVPPDLPYQAFASVSFGRGGQKVVMLHDRNGDNWKRADRLRYVAHASLLVPHEKQKSQIRHVSFMIDRESKRRFATVFDPETQRVYMVEIKKPADILKLCPVCNGHMQVVIRERLAQERGGSHG